MSTPRPTIGYVELPAADLQATKDFYATVFGWEWTDYGPTYAANEGGTPEIGLNGLARPSPAHASGAENAIGPLLLVHTDEIEAVQTAVSAAGGVILSSIYGYPGGRRFHFQDPSSNVLGVYQSDAPPAND